MEPKVLFGEALEALRAGKKVARKSWRDTFLYMVKGSTFVPTREPMLSIFPSGLHVSYQDHIDIAMPGICGPWFPLHVDLFADDWEIVP